MNEAEFTEFFRSIRPRLLRFAMREVDADTANDIAIDALHTIWIKNIAGPQSKREQRQLESLAFRVSIVVPARFGDTSTARRA